MLLTETDPILEDWNTPTRAEAMETAPVATARAVSQRLGRMEVADIDAALVPYLAAAVAELALVAGIPWRFGTDDAPVALLRMLAKATIVCPTASGPHTSELFALLS